MLTTSGTTEASSPRRPCQWPSAMQSPDRSRLPQGAPRRRVCDLRACACPVASGQRRMWCRSVLRPSFPRTPIELQRCFATPAVPCRRGGLPGVSGRVSRDIAGRTDSAAHVADTPRPGRCRLADYADAPRVSSRSRRRRGQHSMGPGPSLAGEPDWRPSRPDRRPSRPVVSPTYAQGSYYGTNRVVAGAPGRFTGPAAPLLSTERAAQPSGRSPSRSRSHVVRTGRVFRKNRTRGRGGGDAGAGAGAGQRQRVTRRHLDAYLDEFVFRSNRRHNLAVAFGDAS
jgi:hypothetical protein